MFDQIEEENKPPVNAEKLGENQNAYSRNSKTKIFAFVILVVIFAAGLGWYFYQKAPQKSGGKQLGQKERNLTESQKKIYYDRIKKAQDDLKGVVPGQADFKIRQINDYIYLGQQYFGLGHLEESKLQYLKALSLDAKNENALMGIALTYSDAGELESARDSIEKALSNNSQNPGLWLEYIDLRKILGANPDEIEAQYELALLGTNRNVDILTRYAQFWENRGSLDKAILFWEEAMKKNPENKEAYAREINRLKNFKQ